MREPKGSRSPDVRLAMEIGLPGQNLGRRIALMGGAETLNNMQPEARAFMIGLLKKSTKLKVSNERD